jgi:inorganic pyrophosphatase/exopolyphosphatase
MFAMKTKYTAQHLEEALRSDCKMIKNKDGQPYLAFQLEIASSEFLQENTEVPNLLQKISREQSLEYYFLVVQDILAGKTLLLTNDEQVIERLRIQDLHFTEFDAQWYQAESIFMRKTVLQKLKA